MNDVLILNDGRMGHLNQSIAFAKYLNLPYQIVDVRFSNKFCKILSYAFDNIGFKTNTLFQVDISKRYDIIIGTGSTTYYATKVLAKEMHAKSIVMMFPQGYRLDFDTIFAQSHDNPPSQKNIIKLPANFSNVEPQGIYKAKKKSIGIVIGGDNKVFTMSDLVLREQLDFIQAHYKEYEIAITTSPRTSLEIEKLVQSYHFDYEVIFSQNPINPIPDFLEQCESVIITGDSTSMVSEAVSYGNSSVVILPLESQNDNKFTRFIDSLAKEGYLHIFNGSIENKNKKINFATYTQKVMQ